MLRNDMLNLGRHGGEDIGPRIDTQSPSTSPPPKRDRAQPASSIAVTSNSIGSGDRRDDQTGWLVRAAGWDEDRIKERAGA